MIPADSKKGKPRRINPQETLVRFCFDERRLTVVIEPAPGSCPSPGDEGSSAGVGLPPGDSKRSRGVGKVLEVGAPIGRGAKFIKVVGREAFGLREFAVLALCAERHLTQGPMVRREDVAVLAAWRDHRSGGALILKWVGERLSRYFGAARPRRDEAEDIEAFRARKLAERNAAKMRLILPVPNGDSEKKRVAYRWNPIHHIDRECLPALRQFLSNEHGLDGPPVTELLAPLFQSLDALLRASAESVRRGVAMRGLQWVAGEIAQMRGYSSPLLQPLWAAIGEWDIDRGTSLPLFNLGFGRWTEALVSARLEEAERLAREQAAHAEVLQDPACAVAAQQAIGATCSFMGKVAPCKAALLAALDGAAQHREHLHRIAQPQSIEVSCLCDLARALHIGGDVDHALERNREALRHADALRSPFDRGFALFAITMLHQYRGEPELALDYGRTLRSHSDLWGFRQFSEMGRSAEAWAKATADGPAEQRLAHVAEMRDAITTLEKMSGAMIARAADHSLLAELLFNLGHHEEALGEASHAIDSALASGDQFYLADSYRIRAVVHARVGGRDAAAADFQRAREVADGQGAHWHSLRVVLSELDSGVTPRTLVLPRLRAVLANINGGDDLSPVVRARALCAASE